MNEEILKSWLEQGKISVNSEDYQTLLFFAKYFDKASLRLHEVNNNFYTFTNDAQFITLSYQEIINYVKDLKRGIPFPWEDYEEK